MEQLAGTGSLSHFLSCEVMPHSPLPSAGNTQEMPNFVRPCEITADHQNRAGESGDREKRKNI